MGLKENITGVAHIGIPTNDMEETIRFYTGLGFDVVYETVNEKADEKVAFLQAGSLMIETYENHQAALIDGAVDHIAVAVTDIKAVYEYLLTHGYTLTTPEIESLPFWENGVSFCKIKGPNGESIEFCQQH